MELILGLMALLYSAWLFTFVWGWFVSPIFLLPLINIPQVMGLSVVVGFFRSLPEKNSGIEGIIMAIVKDTILFIIAWAFHFIVQ